jgi:hypothetical protein
MQCAPSNARTYVRTYVRSFLLLGIYLTLGNARENGEEIGQMSVRQTASRRAYCHPVRRESHENPFWHTPVGVERQKPNQGEINMRMEAR